MLSHPSCKLVQDLSNTLFVLDQSFDHAFFLIFIFVSSIQELREERHALKVARGETVGPEEDTLIPPSLRGGPDNNDSGWGGHPRGGGFNYAGKHHHHYYIFFLSCHCQRLCPEICIPNPSDVFSVFFLALAEGGGNT